MANGDQYGLFWNSTSGDRLYDSDSFETWLRKFFTSGVFNGDLGVSAAGAMVVKIGTGYANLYGKVRFFSNETNFTIAAANSTYPRIDTIVIERNNTNREITAKVVQGEYSGTSPAATERVWGTNGIYQLVVAEIYVGAGVTEITAANITDKRLDDTVCGYITGTVQNIDFSEIKAQFDSWFEGVKDTLDKDTAGHLLNLINAEVTRAEAAETSNKDDIATKVTAISGSGTVEEETEESTYVTVDKLGYDATNKRLIMKVDGADTLVPFNSEPDIIEEQTISYTLDNAETANIDIIFNFPHKIVGILSSVALPTFPTRSNYIISSEVTDTNTVHFIITNAGGRSSGTATIKCVGY